MVPDGEEQKNESGFLQANLSVAEKLERARMELLDLSARNRLLSIPRSAKSARTIEVIDEKSDEVFRILVTENRAFTFLPGRAAILVKDSADNEAEEIGDLAQPDETVNERGIFSRHADTKLQTRLTSKGLQKKLLDLYFDARTLEEEQGVNILFLGLGTLKWVDPTNAKNVRYAPLILIPVTLERGNAAEQFKLKWRQEDSASNLSLEAYLDRVHSLKLPPFEAGEEIDTVAYMDAIADAVKTKTDWHVAHDDIVLGFFSFSKFLMYRDLDPSIWPTEGGLTSRPLIKGLLSEGFASGPPLLPDDVNIDAYLSPADLLHIVDCDSSQALAVNDVRGGRNLVIQGPPGTGKSQTIANVIASAIADGKTVLFVAEKMAALEVVKRRLDAAGVGDACLELHSNKANKKVLLNELKRTSELGAPVGEFATTLNSRLQEARDLLNAHAERLHEPHPVARLTPYQVIGELTALRQEDFQPIDLRLEGPQTWTVDDRKRRESLITDLAQRIGEIGAPLAHPWRGVGVTTILPTDVERLVRRIQEVKTRVDAIHSGRSALARSLEMDAPIILGQIAALNERADHIATSPTLSGRALSSQCWAVGTEQIDLLISSGEALRLLESSLSSVVRTASWTSDVSALRAAFDNFPLELPLSAMQTAVELHSVLPSLTSESGRLMLSLGGQENIDTLALISKKLLTAERVAAAPDASPEVFVATVWDQGIEQAADLAEAVAIWETSRRALEVDIVDAAMEMDLSAARQFLAMHGTSILRIFSGDWRRSNTLVKSILKRPDVELPDKLNILDRLAKAQKALATIRNNDEFGRAAFGVDWRADRTSPAPLSALVEWMRSLRGLGAEPRLLAGKLPDRSAIGARADRLRQMAQEVRSLMLELWDALESERNALFPNALGVEDVSLTSMAEVAAKLASMYERCTETFERIPGSASAIQATLDNLILAQSALKVLDDGNELGRAAFDQAWLGKNSDWDFLRASGAWVKSNPDIRLVAARHDDRTASLSAAVAVEQKLVRVIGDIDGLFSELHSDTSKLFNVKLTQHLDVAELSGRLTLWIDFSEQLSQWVAYRERVDQARNLGLGEFVNALETGAVDPGLIRRAFDMAYYEALFKDQVAAMPDLARFDGKIHGRLVRDFALLDRERIAASSLEVVNAHYRRIPQGGGGVGPLGILRGEMARRRGHMPIRQLMLKAAPAIQSLKPVLMMSPLSVAQFLPPGHLTFDLLVMDEASQIQPVDALGAIARCRQVVVVGDERQLPPTKFFSKMTSASQDDDEPDDAQVADIESILGLFSARGLPQRMLRWHYRSRHQSLIAVSNSQFYENKLFIVPSPYTNEAGMGLQFRHVQNGIFDSGNTGVNPIEAAIVAEAVIQHARANPELSLGVATFSVKQRTAIQDHLELLRRQHPDAEAFFNQHPNEPFFVKNLENVQGDERDVIFISVGYGRNAQGYMAMRFGPLSADGGERRLNVLISRAKRRCEVFSSITDDDIDLERGKGKGVVAFKLFLHFARTGRLSMAQTTFRQYESQFEVQVAKALQQQGYQVHPQVGIAGFFIDLAIADTERPGRYLLGIECDGASYHSSRSARDRDRLRQAVLEDHGWIIHRIWSADWFNRPQNELQRLLNAISAAKVELDARSETALKAVRAVPVKIVSIDRGSIAHIGLVTSSGDEPERTAYIEASPIRPAGGYELHEAPTAILAGLITEIVKIESPVHADEIVVRLRAAWGLKRAGGRIQAAVERALEAALSTGDIAMEERFLAVPGNLAVRDRSNVISEGLRKPEMLPPKEIELAVHNVIKNNFGASMDEIVLAVSRSFGFKATSSQIREMIRNRTDSMVSKGVLARQGENLILNT
nr:DUF3320 domain-containing protein [uncultured Duganella sp.]